MFLKMCKFWFLSTSVQILNLELKVFMLIPNPITSEYPNERQNNNPQIPGPLQICKNKHCKVIVSCSDSVDLIDFIELHAFDIQGDD